MTEKQISVIVVDDSALIRQLLTEMLNGAPDIKVVAQAPDPLVARELIKQHNPDVMTLDVEMPNMDGLSFLQRIMTLRPMPVVMCSTLTANGAEATLRALELGAVDFITKPTVDVQKHMAALSAEIRIKVRAAAKAKVKPYEGIIRQAVQKPPAPVAPPMGMAVNRLIAIGSSTGGVEAVTEVLTKLPADCPPVVITQHMPEKFTTSFAARLNTLSQLNVAEAVHGTRLQAGHGYVAPGNFHMEVERLAGVYTLKVYQDPPVSGHRPSVDVLFRSVARAAGANAVGVILTGMGRDGAEGLLDMRKAGARTVGQDEISCVVYGMPKAAFDIGAVEKQAPLKDIAAKALEFVRAAPTKA